MRYISRISSAIQNISEGDLNTAIEVRGDDEFTAMAVNLNKMVGDIRNLMDKEREAERTKNELITNVAHDLRTPLTRSSAILNFCPARWRFLQKCRKNILILPMQNRNVWKN